MNDVSEMDVLLKYSKERIKNGMLKYCADYLKRAEVALSKPNYKPYKQPHKPLKIHKAMGNLLRFRTLEDANLAIASILNKKPVPEHLLIWPFIAKIDCIVANPEYANAPIELAPVFKQP